MTTLYDESLNNPLLSDEERAAIADEVRAAHLRGDGKERALQKRRFMRYVRYWLSREPGNIAIVTGKLQIDVTMTRADGTRVMRIRSGASYTNGMPVEVTLHDNFMHPVYFWFVVKDLARFNAWITALVATHNKEVS